MIKNNWLDKLFETVIVLIAISLFFPHIISSILTIVLIALWILSGKSKNILLGLRNRYVYLFISIYILSAISLIYSNNLSEGLFTLEKMLSIIIFPIVTVNNMTAKLLRRTVLGFAISCFIISLACLINAGYRNYEYNSLNSIVLDYYGVDMSNSFIGISHVYMGMYVSFSVIIFTYFFFNNYNYNPSQIFIFISTIVFLLFFLILLGGKMSIIGLLFISIIAGINYMFKYKNWIIAVLLIILPISIFYVGISHFQITKNRFYNLVDQTNYKAGDNQWNSIASRFSAMKCVIEVVKEHPVIGAGVGDGQDDLDSCYEKYRYYTMKGMNPHNQYIQFLLETGIIGMILFILCLIYPLYKSYFQGNQLYVLFILLFSFCCLTESMLETNKGIVFYSFFNSLFSFHFLKTSDNKQFNE